MSPVFKKFLLITISFFLFSGVAHAESNNTINHNIGLSYVSGVSDVFDFYDKNPNLYFESTPLPIGISYKATYNIDNGIRIDAGVGPIAFITGAVDYLDIPLNITAGYTFLKNNRVRPYVRGGISYHIMSGDYILDKAGMGILGAAGLKIRIHGRFAAFVELSYDTAEATFEIIDPYWSYYDKETIKLSSAVLTAGVSF